MTNEQDATQRIEVAESHARQAVALTEIPFGRHFEATELLIAAELFHHLTTKEWALLADLQYARSGLRYYDPDDECAMKELTFGPMDAELCEKEIAGNGLMRKLDAIQMLVLRKWCDIPRTQP